MYVVATLKNLVCVDMDLERLRHLIYEGRDVEIFQYFSSLKGEPSGDSLVFKHLIGHLSKVIPTWMLDITLNSQHIENLRGITYSSWIYLVSGWKIESLDLLSKFWFASSSKISLLHIDLHSVTIVFEYIGQGEFRICGGKVILDHHGNMNIPLWPHTPLHPPPFPKRLKYEIVEDKILTAYDYIKDPYCVKALKATATYLGEPDYFDHHLNYRDL